MFLYENTQLSYVHQVRVKIVTMFIILDGALKIMAVTNATYYGGTGVVSFACFTNEQNGASLLSVQRYVGLDLGSDLQLDSSRVDTITGDGGRYKIYQPKIGEQRDFLGVYSCKDGTSEVVVPILSYYGKQGIMSVHM